MGPILLSRRRADEIEFFGTTLLLSTFIGLGFGVSAVTFSEPMEAMS
jgi:hypothetical protein